METTVKITMLESDFKALPADVRKQMRIEVVEVEFDYTADELWQKLSKASREAYKALKEREFKLRHP